MLALLLVTAMVQEHPQLPGAYIDTGGTAADSALLDVDGDADLDFVCPRWTIGETGHLDVALGRGDGSFVLLPSIGPLADSTATRVCPIQLDGDGWTDLVVAYSSAEGLTRVHGTGSPAVPFVLGSTISAGFKVDTNHPRSFQVADLDADGDDDIVSFEHVEDRVHVLLAQAGGFVAGQVFDSASNFYAAGLVVADMDHDGVLDLIVACTGQARWLRGLGGGSFAAPVVLLVPGGTQEFQSVASADLDADGELDLVLTRTVSAASYRGHGDGSFTSWFTIPGAGYDDLLVEDFTGDARPDLVVNGFKSLSSFQGLGNGSFVPRSTIATAFTPRHLHRGDVNGDGRPDVVTLVDDGHAQIFTGAGDAGFDAARTSPQTVANASRAARLFDGDGDGDLDLHVLHEFSIEVLRNDGAAAFTGGQVLSPGGGSLNLRGLAVVPEGVLSSNQVQGVLLAWPSTGGTGYGAPISTPVPGSPFGVVADDLDGDGDTDAVVTLLAGWGPPVVRLGSGDGHFTPPAAPPVPLIGSEQLLALGSLDGDAFPDLVTADDFNLTFLSGTGSGGFTSVATLPLPAWARALAIGDVDQDGDLDAGLAINKKFLMIVRDTGTSWVPEPMVPLNIFGDAVELADLDGDGQLEALISGNDAVAVAAPGPSGYELVSEHDVIQSYGPMAVGDLDGDDDIDVAVPNHSTITVLGNRHDAWDGLGHALGPPLLAGAGSLAPGSTTNLRLSEARPNAFAMLICGLDAVVMPWKGGTLVPQPLLLIEQLVGADGTVHLSGPWPAGLPVGTGLVMQMWVVDPAGPWGLRASNGLRAVQP